MPAEKTARRCRKWQLVVFSGLSWVGLTLLAVSPSIAEVGELLLWRGLGSQGNPFYLFGSLHHVPPSCYPLDEVVEAAYQSAEIVAVEVDTSSAETAILADMLGRYPKGGRLERDVPGALLARVKAVAKRNGWDWNRVRYLRPWVVASMIAAADFEASGYSREMGMDVHFAQAAKRDQKRVVELESVRQQFDTFNRMPRDWQLFLLQDSVNAVSSGTNVDTLAQLVDAWKNGNIDRFQELTEASLAEAPRPEALARALYGDRNEKMARRIERLVAQGHRLFAVVGSAHLVGRASLVELLRERGLSIERMSVGSRPGRDSTDETVDSRANEPGSSYWH